MQRVFFSVIVMSALVLSGCQKQQIDLAQETLDLLETDREFAAMSVEQGYVKAYDYYMSDDAMVLPPKVYPEVGRETIIAKWTAEDFGGELDWEPQRAEISCCGHMGWTWGNWTWEMETDTGKVSAYGKYVNIWKKIDGQWKMTTNIWNDNPAPEAAMTDEDEE